jgi:hypothetical protein
MRTDSNHLVYVAYRGKGFLAWSSPLTVKCFGKALESLGDCIMQVFQQTVSENTPPPW